MAKSFEAPPEVRAGLIKLALLSEEHFRHYFATLENHPPTVFPSSIWRNSALEETGLDRDDVESITRAILSLSSAMETFRLTSTETAEIASSARNYEAVSVERVVLQQRIEDIITLDSIAVSAKALDLRMSFKTIYKRSRVITENRPLFREDVSNGLGGSLILHNLQISVTEDETEKELYIGLDVADLEELQRQIDRALAKQKVLKTMLRETGVPYLGVDQDD